MCTVKEELFCPHFSLLSSNSMRSEGRPAPVPVCQPTPVSSFSSPGIYSSFWTLVLSLLISRRIVYCPVFSRFLAQNSSPSGLFSQSRNACTEPLTAFRQCPHPSPYIAKESCSQHPSQDYVDNLRGSESNHRHDRYVQF